jgi:c(7)-type cytochrome triheme protein
MRIAAVVVTILAAGVAHAQEFKLPPHPPAAQFGNVLMTRTTAHSAMKSVVFPHWRHRMLYTCRVCHLELDFAMRQNATEKSENACGTCHDGRTAFGIRDEKSCARCHTGAIEETFDFAAKTAELPRSELGNGIDWSKALASGQIHPAESLSPGFEPLSLDTTLSLEAEWAFVPPAIFPHPEHIRWLDCANCHPEPFNVKKKTTKHFSMKLNLARQFCGACHVRVAFPLDDCKRCHPAMENAPVD